MACAKLASPTARGKLCRSGEGALAFQPRTSKLAAVAAPLRVRPVSKRRWLCGQLELTEQRRGANACRSPPQELGAPGAGLEKNRPGRGSFVALPPSLRHEHIESCVFREKPAWLGTGAARRRGRCRRSRLSGSAAGALELADGELRPRLRSDGVARLLPGLRAGGAAPAQARVSFVQDRFDVQLIEAARSGAPSALERLLVACQPELRRYAQRSCLISDVDDAVQEALLIASRYLRSLRHARAWSRWMFRIVRRECHRMARIGLRRDVWGDRLVDQLVARRSEDELRHDLTAALESLPEPYREVLVLRDFEGLTITEMADRLTTSTAAIKGRLHRARELTREYLLAPSTELHSAGA